MKTENIDSIQLSIKGRGTVFSGEQNTNHQSCIFPGICILPSGRWLCSCRAAPTKSATAGQHPVLSWSDDEGRSWHEPFSPFEPAIVNGRLGLFRVAYLSFFGGDRVLAVLNWVDHSDPSLPFFNTETEGLLDTRIFLSISDDRGETWSTPEIMDTSPIPPATPLTGPALHLSNGGLACQFELNKLFYDRSVWRHSSVLIFSKDGGRTWPEHSIASNDPENRIFYWDQRPGCFPDGRILDLFWTYDNQAAVYLNIHGRESLDNGRTWSDFWDTGVPGQPAAPVLLPDGRLGMVYVDRTNAPVIRMRSTGDYGRTWPDVTEIILYQTASASQTWEKKSMDDAWAEMAKYSVGLPATARLDNGDILVVYYAGPETDRTDIQWVRVGAGVLQCPSYNG
ncbi:MAG: exo-alpha-sialidase [Spirochaetales bacterium]|jgi:hypothetical protein|nr:exo-alpha-sialidase [Spirochaetales bacterium]